MAVFGKMDDFPDLAALLCGCCAVASAICLVVSVSLAVIEGIRSDRPLREP
jgi:hypothetical protein